MDIEKVVLVGRAMNSDHKCKNKKGKEGVGWARTKRTAIWGWRVPKAMKPQGWWQNELHPLRKVSSDSEM